MNVETRACRDQFTFVYVAHVYIQTYIHTYTRAVLLTYVFEYTFMYKHMYLQHTYGNILTIPV